MRPLNLNQRMQRKRKPTRQVIDRDNRGRSTCRNLTRALGQGLARRVRDNRGRNLTQALLGPTGRLLRRLLRRARTTQRLTRLNAWGGTLVGFTGWLFGSHTLMMAR